MFGKLSFAFLAFLVLFITFLSCSEESFLENPEVNTVVSIRESQERNISSGSMVLGNEIINPYTVEIVNEAQNLLYGSSEPFSATHHYVKFKPTDQEDLAKLADWRHKESIVLFDFPLHFTIIEDGDYYIDPEIIDTNLIYQYASIPVSKVKPEVPYDLIEELYLDDSNPFLFIQTYLMTGHKDKLHKVIGSGIPYSVVQSYLPSNLGPGDETLCDLTQLPPPPNCEEGTSPVIKVEQLSPVEWDCYWVCEPTPPSPPPALNQCGCQIPPDPRIPAGCLQVENDSGNEDPVKIAKVTVWDWSFPFKQSDEVHTDRNGCWSLSRRYDEISVKVIFDNDNLKVRDLSYWVGFRVLRDKKKTFDNPPYNNIRTRYDELLQRRSWAASHTLNSDLEYRDAVTADGVPSPRTRLNYLLRAGSGQAAAPMLQGNPFNSQLAVALSFAWPALILNLATSGLQPDIINQYYNGEQARLFKGINAHELGHASHYAMEGEGYWWHYRNHIINNNGYGTYPIFSIGSQPGRVALGEAIGSFAGHIYGGLFSGGENSQFENNYIPEGLMFDLVDGGMPDVITDPNTMTSVSDVISGFTPSMIFDGLENSVDIRTYRDNLRNLHLSNTTNTFTDFNNLLDGYDVFN